MQDQTEALRAALEKSRAGRKRWRCPAGLRSEVVTYAQSRRGSGVGVRLIAVELGLSASGLSRWLKREGRFRSVRVAQAESVAVSAGLVLVTPQGYRLEGLSTSQALHLLREL